MSSPFLSVIVPIRSGATAHLGLVRSMRTQTLAMNAEVLLISNPEPLDAIPSTLTEGLNIRTLHCRVAGANRARHLGVNSAQGQWLYFLDDDCTLPDSEHLARVAAVAQSLQPSQIAGGPYRLSGNTSAASKAYDQVQARWVRSGAHSRHGWIHFLGGNLLVHASVFKNFAFDESIVFGGSETEFIFRLLLNGHSGVFREDLTVLHQHHLTMLQMMRKASLQGFTKEKCRMKHLDIAPERISFWTSDRSPETARMMAVFLRAFEDGRRRYREDRPHPTDWELRKLAALEMIKETMDPFFVRRHKLDNILGWVRQEL